MKKSRKLVCHVVSSNIANDSVPTLQVSVGIRALFEKTYGEPDSQISGRMYCTIPLFPLVNDVRNVSQPDTIPVSGKQLLISNDRNRVR